MNMRFRWENTKMLTKKYAGKELPGWRMKKEQLN